VSRTPGLLLLAVSLTGCISYCKASPILVRAASGDLEAMDETGNLGRPRLPSTAEALPLIRDGFEALQPGLASPSERTRVEAVEGLRHLSERAVDVFRNHYSTIFEAPLGDPSREVRWRAAWAVGRLGVSSPALRHAAEDPDDGVAAAALEALGRAFDEEGIEALDHGLDRSEPVRRAAMTALGRLAGRSLPDVDACRAFIAARRRAHERLDGGSNQDTAPISS
jgi:hypothetical protein